jgi:methionyl-tRNA synthetase
VIGKDITRLHCVVWPAMLESAGLPLPAQVWAHGFVDVGGERLSKSAGVRLELSEAIDRHGPDAFRYFLLREIPWDGDGSFSFERFDERYTAELANDLGNLANRTLTMVAKYRAGTVAAAERTSLDERADRALERYRESMDACSLHEGAAAALALVADANLFVGAQAPWKLAREPERAAELDAALRSLVRALAVVAVLLSPFMPSRMADLWQRLGSARDLPLLDELPSLDPAGWQTAVGEVLFPRPELAAERR